MSELNISLIIEGDRNKGEYISSDQVVKYEGEACINDQEVHEKKTRWLGTAQLSKKRRIFLPEEKRVAEAIEYRISIRLKASYRWINNNMRRDILNY